MKSTFSWALAAVAVGVVAGAAVGYWEARPWAANASVDATIGGAPGDAAADDAAPGDAPQAVVGETTFRFGNMESGAKQRRGFPVRNAGGGPLTINYVSHTCKCTGVEMDGKKVEPGASIVVPAGEEKEILLEWAAKVPAGPFRHGASFTTTDPAMPRVELTVEGEIVESTTLEPSQLLFGSVLAGEPGRAELIVMAFLEDDVEILSHEVQDAQLAERVAVLFEPVPVDQLPDPKAKAGVRVIATFQPGGTLGPFAGSLSLDTNLKQAPHLEVPIYGTVKGDISIFGTGWTEANGLLRIGPATTAAGGKSRLLVNIRGEHAADAELSVERVDPPELEVTLGERSQVRDGLVSVPLFVEIPPGTRPMVRAGEDQGGEGEIVLATGHPVTPNVRLRVTFTVEP